MFLDWNYILCRTLKASCFNIHNAKIVSIQILLFIVNQVITNYFVQPVILVINIRFRILALLTCKFHSNWYGKLLDELDIQTFFSLRFMPETIFIWKWKISPKKYFKIGTNRKLELFHKMSISLNLSGSFGLRRRLNRNWMLEELLNQFISF